jgi:hypothetical protein
VIEPKIPRAIPETGSAGSVHRLRRLRSRRNPGLQRAGLRSFVDKIETFELAFDPQNVGETEGWFTPGRKQFDQLVAIGPIELLPFYTATANGKTVVWYRKTIIIERQIPGKHYKINFARAFYRTKVWGNGRLLEDVDGRTEHISGFSAFSYDLSGVLDTQGKVELIIRVENSDDPAICRGKQWSQQYPREGIWYNQASGIWGQVTLEEVSANRLRSDITGYADPVTGLVRLQAKTLITDKGTYTLEALVDTPEGNNTIQYRRVLNLKSGQHSHELAFVVPDAQPWSPANPQLYEVEVNLRSDGNIIDRVFFNIGFRSLVASGSRLLLNGQPIYLDSVLYQPYHGDSYTLDYDQLKAELEYARQVTGCNLLRIHIAGADPLPLHLADALGLLVWVEVPSPHVSNEVSRANHRNELESLLRQIDTHPCVAIVSIYNESWGCQDIGEASEAGEATRRYIKQAYRYIKQQRPDLLVVDNDGWEHICEDGRLVATDLLTLHLYVNTLEAWENDLANLPQLCQNQSARFRELTGKPAVIGDEYEYHEEIPLFISEWGGFGALYGGPAAQLEKFELIRRYKTTLYKHENIVAGDCYTQLGDVENETNGLLDKAQKRISDPEFIQASKNLLAGEQENRGI